SLSCCFRSRGTTTPATSATPTATRADFFDFFVRCRFGNLRGFGSRFQQGLDAFMRRLDQMLALNSRLLNLLGSGLLRRGNIAFLTCIDDDAFELGFFVEEIRNVKEGVAFQPDIDKDRLER